MRSLKEYNPTPMSERHVRPNPSVEGNGFRIRAFELGIVVAFLILSFSLMTS